MHIIVTHLGCKAVKYARLRLANNLQYAAKVQLQDLKELFSALWLLSNNSKTSHFASSCCVLDVGYLFLT